MDEPEITAVGMKIVELGSKLKKLKADRDELTMQITAIEAEIAPLLVRHTQLIAEITGMLIPKPVAPEAPSVEASPTPGRVDGGLKKRVLKFLQGAEPGVGAVEVADALKLDAALVRQVMMEMARGK